jgi:dihydropteroate synthase
MRLSHARGSLELDHCLVMAIVNRTPDSFYDGGRTGLKESVDHALRSVDEGAEILDLGAVKAGPGADVSHAEEIERLLPLVEEIAGKTDVPISVETSRPEVAERAFQAGAAILNDVSGLSDRRLAEVCAASGAGLILMHHGGQLRGRPLNPRYDDVVEAVRSEWERLIGIATAAGVPEEAIVVDPGLDFGKTTFHSLELMRRLEELTGFSRPVLIAASRKDVVGETLGLPPDQRLEGSLALVALSAAYGAAVVRVHDVQASARTARMVEAVLGRRDPLAAVRGLWE